MNSSLAPWLRLWLVHFLKGEWENVTEQYAVASSDPKLGIVPPVQYAPAESLSDTPRAPRRRVLKSGIIAFNDRFSAVPCIVRDLSGTGAHLRVEGTLNVPNAFELIIQLDGLEASCEVVWRKDKEIGVRFLSAPRAVTPTRTQVVKALVARQGPTLRRKPPAQQR